MIECNLKKKNTCVTFYAKVLHNQGKLGFVPSLFASSALKCSLTPRQNYVPWQLKQQSTRSFPTN